MKELGVTPEFFEAYQYDALFALARSTAFLYKEMEAGRCTYNDTRCYSRKGLLTEFQHLIHDGVTGKTIFTTTTTVLVA